MAGKIDGTGSLWKMNVPQPANDGTHGNHSGQVDYPPTVPAATPGQAATTQPGMIDPNAAVGK